MNQIEELENLKVQITTVYSLLEHLKQSMCADSILSRHGFKELNKLDAELSSLDSEYLTFQEGGFRDFQINNLLPILPLKKRETEKTALNGWPSLTTSSFMRIYMKNF